MSKSLQVKGVFLALTYMMHSYNTVLYKCLIAISIIHIDLKNENSEHAQSAVSFFQ